MKRFNLLVVCACVLSPFAIAHAWPVESTLRRLDVEAIFDSDEISIALNRMPIDSIRHLDYCSYVVVAEACEIQIAIDYGIDNDHIPGGPTSITPRVVSRGTGCEFDDSETSGPIPG